MVRSNSKTILLNEPPVCARKVASRHFLNERSLPSLPKEGNSLQAHNFGNNQRFGRTKLPSGLTTGNSRSEIRNPQSEIAPHSFSSGGCQGLI